MKKAFAFALLAACAASLATSQDIDMTGAGNGRESLKNIVLDAIENEPGRSLSADSKDIVLSWLPAGPELAAAQEREHPGRSNTSFLRVAVPGGVGTRRFRLLFPVRPSVPGIVKLVSFWMTGPESGAVSCALIVRDIHGIEYELPVSVRAEPGVKYCSASIPPGIPQLDGYLPGQLGLSVAGFVMTCRGSPAMTFGLDLMDATADFFFATDREVDSMEGTW
ncbi:MAG: hypothetical protein NT080_09370 [Spirochaetes bacterium]|nr:hypothetical protein [Spirochaetota bacterium]